MILAHRSISFSVPLKYITKPLSLDSYATSRASFLSRYSSLRVRRWSASEDPPHPATARISSALPCVKPNYFSWADITGFRSPTPDLLTGIVIRAPTTEERVFFSQNKRRGKKVSWIVFSTPANESPVSNVIFWINIHSGWIARTTAA